MRSHAYKMLFICCLDSVFLKKKKSQGALCPMFSHSIQVRKAQKYCMSEAFPAASLDLLPKLIEILLTEHSTSLWYLTLQNSFEGLGWIMKETRASGVHYLPHFIRRFYKVCCLPFQIHDRNKYKAWKEQASQSCLLPSPLPPSTFLPLSQDTFVLSQLNVVLFLPNALVCRRLFIARNSFLLGKVSQHLWMFLKETSVKLADIFQVCFLPSSEGLEDLSCDHGGIMKT